MSKQKGEYEKFDALMRKLIAVPHEAVKSQLDAEKAEKKKRKAKEPSVSGRESRE